ncbi:unnamed protein product [Amoebophrya sp. A120]|nr:unnamed protein product [Amoebophrya sp. A120]CAD7931858.1 unnamed protein product [Amoebophrya sp. A120]|eukprot:GSA120T00021086001.1
MALPICAPQCAQSKTGQAPAVAPSPVFSRCRRGASWRAWPVAPRSLHWHPDQLAGRWPALIPLQWMCRSSVCLSLLVRPRCLSRRGQS